MTEQYTYETSANVSKLDEEMQAASFAELYAGTSSLDGTTIVYTSAALSAGEEDELDGIIAAHNPQTASLEQMLGAAIGFGRALMHRWSLIIMADLFGTGDDLVVALALSNATIMAQTGNLFALEAELGTIDPIETYLDETRLTAIRNEIRDYLGMPPL